MTTEEFLVSLVKRLGTHKTPIERQMEYLRLVAMGWYPLETPLRWDGVPAENALELWGMISKPDWSPED